jgi:hypothetical protein
VLKDTKTKERLPLGERLSLGLGMVNLNQGLIQFADTKANGLVLIDSIFLAVMAPNLGVLRGGLTPLALVIGAFFVTCALGLLAALRVIVARAATHADARPRSLIFYKHIASFGRAHDYVEDFRDADGERVLESVLASNYDLAGIAQAKFRAYKTAEHLTLLSAVLWVAGMVLEVL